MYYLWSWNAVSHTQTTSSAQVCRTCIIASKQQALRSCLKLSPWSCGAKLVRHIICLGDFACWLYDWSCKGLFACAPSSASCLRRWQRDWNCGAQICFEASWFENAHQNVAVAQKLCQDLFPWSVQGAGPHAWICGFASNVSSCLDTVSTSTHFALGISMRFVLLCFSTMTVLSLGTCFAAPSIGKLHT